MRAYCRKSGMNCPECGVQQKKKAESHCRCGYKFIFYPETASGMTDTKFLALLRKADGSCRFYFTFPQLYTAWCRQDAEEKRSLLRKRLAGISAVLLALSVLCSALFGWLGGLFPLILLLVPWILLRQYHRQAPPALGTMKKLVKQWRAGNGGGDEMLLLRPSLHEPPSDFPEKDLFDYGVERIIFVERPLLVDLLVRNGFHADLKALIFSQDGYPKYLVPQVQHILKENKSLPIYLLHDAGEAGMAMSRKMNLAGRTVIDLGLRPEQLKKMPLLKELQLHKKRYKAPLDILPWPVLAAICGEAVYAKSSLSQILDQWNTAEQRKSFLSTVRDTINNKKTHG